MLPIDSPPVSALDGVRVIDLTTVVFGPYATQTLADYGAEVIKIETPDGDSTRFNGPSAEPGMAAFFLGCNRNKKSVVLDLKQESAREALLALADTADVFVHNIRPQKLAKLGISEQTLRERNPRLVFAGLLGFGEAGPYSGAPAYDDIIQALSGVVDLTQRYAGTPVYLPTILADKVAGQTAVHAILAALVQRERTGKGQAIEIPMFESVVSFMLVEHCFGGHVLRREDVAGAGKPAMGNARSMSPHRRPYRTVDGHLCVMPYTDEHWRRFFRAVDRPDLVGDSRFVDIAGRTANISALLALLSEIISQRPTAWWTQLCEDLDIPCARINRLDELETDPHLAAVGMFQRLPAAADWDFQYVRCPVRLEDSQVPPKLPPRLGEHTAEVLRSLALPGRTLEQLLPRPGGED